jgi:SAM-dependent methyltransferase
MSFRKFRALARNWEALGDTDPMFGVLSDPTKHGGKWQVDEFFESGRAHVKKLLRTLDDARASYVRGRCLDFGCGVGRLTIPLAESFTHTVGVDVARPMIEAAQRHRAPGMRCEFVVNRHPDLRDFATATFDVVHSCLVLQHIPPDISAGYIAEFFRVCKPGGLVVFQVPAAIRSDDEITATHALPASACAADIEMVEAPGAIEASTFVSLRLVITNRGTAAWRHDIPAGRHLCIGNHWLRDDGATAIQDDARAVLPRTVEPGESVDVVLPVQAPGEPGRYILEIDLVQEHVCWFAEQGSATARAPITVTGRQPGSPQAPPAATPKPTSQPKAAATSSARMTIPRFRSLLRRLRGVTPTFEMHIVPRAEVERVIGANGGQLIRAVDDNAAGAGWLSYTYICRRA